MSFIFSIQKIRNFLSSCAMHVTILSFFLTQGFGQFAFANSVQSVFYVVKKGDTLSEILQALDLRPIYGKTGSLSELLSCHKFDLNGDLIRQGETIRFLYVVGPVVADYVQVLNSGEIVIAKNRVTSSGSKFFRTLPGRLSSKSNFENLCSGSISKITSNAISLKRQPKEQLTVSSEANPQSTEGRIPASDITLNQSERASAATEKNNASTTDQATNSHSRAFFVFEANSALTRQDLRTVAGGYSELLSKASPGLRLQWREDVSPSWDLDFSYAQRAISQSAPELSSINGDSNFTEFAIAGIWNFEKLEFRDTSRWSVGPLLKYRTEPITARLSGSSIRLESPQVLLIGGSLENERMVGPARKNLRLKTDLSAWYAPRASQSDYVISDGYGLSVDIRLMRPIRRQLDLSGGISYGISRFKSTLGEHANQQVIFGFGLIYRFGDIDEVKPSGTVQQDLTRPSNTNGGL